ncbi:MAG TPA: hypothetical protein VHY84_14270 [Bryobacteraceae bacterium]|jgi:predicted kinase|nr:hypothetical protein [Bryobacteraceae bacterium]
MKAGHEGYAIAYAIAEDNLRLENIVVADSVNSIPVTRNAWRDVATRSNAEIVEIEVVCSDKPEHRRRVVGRRADIPGHSVPTWEEVLNREYAPWERRSFGIDTARKTTDEAFRSLLRALTPILQGLDPKAWIPSRKISGGDILTGGCRGMAF